MGLIIGISSAVLLIGLIIVTCAFAGPKIADAMAYREVTRVRPVKTTMNAVSAISAFNLGKKTAGGACIRVDDLHRGFRQRAHDIVVKRCSVAAFAWCCLMVCVRAHAWLRP